MSNSLFRCPVRIVQWLDHLGAMCSRAWHAQCAAGPEFSSSYSALTHPT